MADIATNLEQIRDAFYGLEVRESIASGIEAINGEVEDTTARQTKLETDMATAKEDAILATSEANTARDAANEAAGTANAAASLAVDKAALADEKASLADEKAALADDAADNANGVATQLNNETLIIYKPWVNTYADIATTYPAPALGWTTQAVDTNTRYRWNGSAWINIGVFPDDKTGDMSQIPETDLVSAIKNDRTSLADITSQGENVKMDGSDGTGTIDDTSIFELANSKNKVIIIPPGIYKIQNWIPLTGTKIFAYGATISLYSQTQYGITGSAASVIITNDDIEIYGGVWKDLTGVNATWSGSICIEDGSLKILDAVIEESWGGIFGHLAQNGAKQAENVTIENCTIRNCQHNTYLADIKNLKFMGNYSYGSSRDGLKTYRNVQNVTIDVNHIYNNGNGDIGVSQDGIDLFIAGNIVSIVGNYIYGNKVKGIDIKHSADGDAETVLDMDYIITNNHIFDNLGSGIEFSSDDTRGYIYPVTIEDNHIHDNGQYGIMSAYADNILYSKNHVYNNGYEGIRVESCASGGKVIDNIVYNNAIDPAAPVQMGIRILTTALNVDCIGNRIYEGGTTQTQGLSYGSNGICKDNDVTGHSLYNILGTGVTSSIGQKITTDIEGATASKICILTDKPMGLGGISFISNGTGVFHIQLSKRKQDGSYECLLCDSDITVSTGYLKTAIPISSLTTGNMTFKENQAVFVTVTIVSGSFTWGRLEFNMLT